MADGVETLGVALRTRLKRLWSVRKKREERSAG